MAAAPGRDPDRPGNGPDSGPDDPYAGTREEMQRAIRRLDALEWVILFAAVGFALGGGALVAWILSTGTGLGFRSTWIILSVLLLVIPGAFVFLKERGRS
jgi:hypothetical protein